MDQNTEFTGKTGTRDTNFRTLLKRGERSKEIMQDLESTGFCLHRRGACKGTKERGRRSGEEDETVCYQGCTEKGDPKGRGWW